MIDETKPSNEDAPKASDPASTVFRDQANAAIGAAGGVIRGAVPQDPEQPAPPPDPAPVDLLTEDWFIWDKDQPDAEYSEVEVYAGTPTTHEPGHLAGARCKVCSIDADDLESLTASEEEAGKLAMRLGRAIVAMPGLLVALQRLASVETMSTPAAALTDEVRARIGYARSVLLALGFKVQATSGRTITNGLDEPAKQETGDG